MILTAPAFGGAVKIYTICTDFTHGVRFGFSEVGESYKKFLSANRSKLDVYKGKLRMQSFVYNARCESHDFYAEIYETEINYHIVNEALLLCTYIAENFEPTPYLGSNPGN